MPSLLILAQADRWSAYAVCYPGNREVGAVVRPADPPTAVENDAASLSSDPFEPRQRILNGSLWWLATLKRLHDTGGEQNAGDALAVSGERDTACGIVRIESAARQR
jgi:hypothetical protein